MRSQWVIAKKLISSCVFRCVCQNTIFSLWFDFLHQVRIKETFYEWNLSGGYNMAIFGICQLFNGISLNWIKDGRYSIFQSPNDGGKIQFLIENTKVTVFIQKFYYGTKVIFEKIKSNTVIKTSYAPSLCNWTKSLFLVRFGLERGNCILKIILSPVE